MINIIETFEKFDNEYLNFDSVENKHSTRPDLHAFIMLDILIPNKNRDMVCSAEHDEIYLDVEIDELEQSGITEEQVIDLIRCGVRYDDDNGLCMFA